MSEQGQRTWAGTTLDARQATRREQLMAAGFELLGERGATAVTVRGVTRTARLSERYFYESFADREELLLAVYDQVAQQARASITAGLEAVAGSVPPSSGDLPDPEEFAIAGLNAFTDFLEQDPRRGRVLLLEAFANETLVRHGIELVPTFTELLVAQIGASFESPDEVDATLSGVALVGALTHLYLAWIDGSLTISRDRLVRHAASLIVVASGIHSHEDDNGAKEG